METINFTQQAFWNVLAQGLSDTSQAVESAQSLESYTWYEYLISGSTAIFLAIACLIVVNFWLNGDR